MKEKMKWFFGLTDEQKEMKKELERRRYIPQCPTCKSEDLMLVGKDSKGFSITKAIGGTMLAGSVGSLAGFAGKDGKKTYLCNNCGHTFKSKK